MAKRFSVSRMQQFKKKTFFSELEGGFKASFSLINGFWAGKKNQLW